MIRPVFDMAAGALIILGIALLVGLAWPDWFPNTCTHSFLGVFSFGP